MVDKLLGKEGPEAEVGQILSAINRTIEIPDVCFDSDTENPNCQFFIATTHEDWSDAKIHPAGSILGVQRWKTSKCILFNVGIDRRTLHYCPDIGLYLKPLWCKVVQIIIGGQVRLGSCSHENHKCLQWWSREESGLGCPAVYRPITDLPDLMRLKTHCNKLTNMSLTTMDKQLLSQKKEAEEAFHRALHLYRQNGIPCNSWEGLL